MTSFSHKTPYMVFGGLLALVSHVRARVRLNLLMTLAIKVLIYQISRILYHVLQHPLAKLPGGQESLMTKYIELLVNQLKKKVSSGQEKQDIMSWYMFTTFDILSTLYFTQPMNALAGRAYQPWIVTILNAVEKGSYVRLERAYPLLAGISNLYGSISSGSPKLKTSRTEHMEYPIEKTESRMDSDMKRNDFITLTLLYNGEKGMSRAEIAQTLIFFMTGGTETTASALIGVTYNVLHKKRVFNRLIKEVGEAFSSDTIINNDAVNKLPYLNAYIKESLRLYPPCPDGQEVDRRLSIAIFYQRIAPLASFNVHFIILLQIFMNQTTIVLSGGLTMRKLNSKMTHLPQYSPSPQGLESA